MTTDSTTSPAWHTLSAKAVAEQLGVDAATGLSDTEAGQRLQRYGPNELIEGATRSLWRMFLSQFADFMIAVLLVAALVSGWVGEPQDTIAIVVIVLLNAVIGTVQEFRAERAIAALRRISTPTARVLRNAQPQELDARELVPGDVVLLEAGNLVPADLRISELLELQIEEAALTGESEAVDKIVEGIDQANAVLGDRRNMAFRGTHVARGRGRGVVVTTGMQTELGHIATLLSEAETVRTPLQKRLEGFGRRLAVAILVVCAVVFAAGLLRGEPILLMFMTAVSLAVAAIPEALPAVVTVSLALGARRMSARHALLRNLPAVETLGSVTYVCTDKTGTLTENRMRVDKLWAAGEVRDALPDGAVEPWSLLGRAMALNNDAETRTDGSMLGDPTEVALLQAARVAGFDRPEVERELPRRGEIPFTAERRAMTTLHQDGRGALFITKGAPEAVLERCSQVLTAQGVAPLHRENAEQQALSLADEGYRVMAYGYRRLDRQPGQIDATAVERDLVLLGMTGLIDPPRAETPAAVADCRSAGIRPVMITGDHPGTARTIAKRLGIATDDAVLTGAELDALSDQELATRVVGARVYARVNPEQKIRIVRALQANGEFVAMTGDGVNDAPALKRADIGVAMGLKGTDVSREAADMVLMDDNFATIVSAVREGRRIFDNIRKFIKYTMTSNSGEIWTLFLAPFLGLPLPLLPIQILWINLVTDGLPGLALAAEPEERGIMRRPPRPTGESVFAHGMWQHMIWVGLLIGGLSLGAQWWAYHGGSENWQTVVFTVLTLSQLVHAMAIRSERESLLSLGLKSNLPLLGAVLLTLGLQLAVIYVPVLNGIFHTSPLTPRELGVCLGLPLVVLLAVEMEKWAVRRQWIYREMPRSGSPAPT